MKLVILVDNNTLIDQYYFGEPAVSYYIETEGKKILFDAGYSDVFIQNAARMGIDLSGIDALVLSHGHPDHTWGLPYLIDLFDLAGNKPIKKPLLIAHPEVFSSRKFEEFDELGPNTTINDLAKYFEIRLSKSPVQITPNLLFLGEILRKNEFEGIKSIGFIRTVDGLKPDHILDDSAIAYCSNDGLVIITGCSHSGICNIITCACELMGDNRIIDVIGGFHLLNPTREQLTGTLDYFKKLTPKEIHACHCTDLNSKIALSSVVPLQETGAGLILSYK